MLGARIPTDEQFANDIKQLLKDIEQFKNPQRSGQDSNRMYRIFSEDAIDKTCLGVTFDNTAFRLTFTPDSTQFDTSIVYKMEYTYTEDPNGFVQIETEREKVNSDNSQSWLFVVSGSDFFPSAYVNLKFYFWASGYGTFTIEDL